MNINSISEINQNTSFQAKFNLPNEVTAYIKHMERQARKNAPHCRYKEELATIKKAITAIENHKSPAELDLYIKTSGCEYGTARAGIKSQNADYIDLNQASTSGLNYFKQMFLRFVDPKNKKIFNKILGKEYAGEYDSWWNANIAPIKSDLEKYFGKSKPSKIINKDFFEVVSK